MSMQGIRYLEKLFLIHWLTEIVQVVSQQKWLLTIDDQKITIENSNLAHGMGVLDLQKFEPFTKNPAISKVFREIWLADELGSGMRNSYKYTMLYSGVDPLFEEGDISRTIIPLKKIATQKVGGGNCLSRCLSNVSWRN